MTTKSLPAIDAHAHYGNFVRVSPEPLSDGFMSAAASDVARRARTFGVKWTVVSPLSGLLPRNRADATVGNNDAFRSVPLHPGLLQYVIVNPLQTKTYDQAREMLRSSWCVGIKIHPEEHGYRITDYGDELFSFAEEVQSPVMAHSGCENSLPLNFLPFADRYPGICLLLAHLGNGAGDQMRLDLQVRAVQKARNQNIWIDTSSVRSIMPRLIEWAVDEIGAERILFGSDTPLYHQGMQRARIDGAEISIKDKRKILYENALSFFKLSGKDET